MVIQPILNSLIFTTLQNWHFLTALQIGRKFQWLPDGLCYHSEATDITKKGNFSGFLCNILVPEEATEIDYILQEVTDFAYLELLISVASELIQQVYLSRNSLCQVKKRGGRHIPSLPCTVIKTFICCYSTHYIPAISAMSIGISML